MTDIYSLIRSLERFKDVSADIQVATALTLLYVGRRGVCVQKDIEKELGLSIAAASRNISYWVRGGKSGRDYLQRYEDPNDRRNNMIRLTRDGAEFFRIVVGKEQSSNGQTARH